MPWDKNPDERRGRDNRRPAARGLGDHDPDLIASLERGREVNPRILVQPKPIVAPPVHEIVKPASFVLKPKSRTTKVAESPKLVSVYTSMCPLHQHPDTLVMHCCDGRFDVPTWEFLEHIENQHDVAGFESIVTPGGPATLLLMFGGYFFAVDSYVKKRFLKRLFKRVIGIAHNDCGAYAEKYPRLDVDARNAKAIEDLRLFKETILKIAKHLGITPEVLLYFAKPSEDKVEFLQLK
jgi:hypothetical protein